MKRLLIWCVSSVAVTAVAASAFMYGRSEMQSEFEVGLDTSRPGGPKVRPSVEQVRATAESVAASNAVLSLIQTKAYELDTITGRRQRLEEAWRKSDPQRWEAFDINDRHLVTFYAVKFSDDLLNEKKFERVQLNSIK